MNACMGGWCTKRDHCTHYHRADRDEPSERLCKPGDDGAYVPINLRPAEPTTEDRSEPCTQ